VRYKQAVLGSLLIFSSFVSAANVASSRYPSIPADAERVNRLLSSGADGRVRVPFKSERFHVVDARFQDNTN
jgi:hypothetical protein